MLHDLAENPKECPVAVSLNVRADEEWGILSSFPYFKKPPCLKSEGRIIPQ
jgi:hypothetical protein